MKQIASKKTGGFSLIELIISLFAVSLLMTLLMQQYLLSKRQYTKMRTLLEQNLELQLVTDLISNSLRSAGFTPCASVSSLQSIDRRNGKTQLVAVGLGKEKGLQINKMDDHFATVDQQLSPSQLLIKGDIHYETKQAVLIADCYHAEVHEVLKARKTKSGIVLTLNNSLAFNYIAPIYLGEWIEEEFFVKKNQQNGSSLFYKNKHTDVVSSLIHSLSIHFDGKTHVEVSIGLEKMPNLVIKTEVRGG
ncbi:MAG: hypothetical protein H0U73_06855 [Tatlockia sp.]|nr:hypothetical protein [Tatlockia sp.]